MVFTLYMYTWGTASLAQKRIQSKTNKTHKVGVYPNYHSSFLGKKSKRQRGSNCDKGDMAAKICPRWANLVSQQMHELLDYLWHVRTTYKYIITNIKAKNFNLKKQLAFWKLILVNGILSFIYLVIVVFLFIFNYKFWKKLKM